MGRRFRDQLRNGHVEEDQNQEIVTEMAVIEKKTKKKGLGIDQAQEQEATGRNPNQEGRRNPEDRSQGTGGTTRRLRENDRNPDTGK